MGMEVGVANELVVAVEEGGGVTRQAETRRESMLSERAALPAVSVFFVCVSVCVQSRCNNVQQTAAALRPRLCALALRFRPGRDSCLRADVHHYHHHLPSSSSSSSTSPPSLLLTSLAGGGEREREKKVPASEVSSVA